MMLDELDNEMWLANRIRAHGIFIFEGVTTPEIRKQRMRDAINKIGSEVVVGRGKDRKPVSYARAFEHLYGESLVPPPTHRAGSTESQSAGTAPGAQG